MWLAHNSAVSQSSEDHNLAKIVPSFIQVYKSPCIYFVGW